MLAISVVPRAAFSPLSAPGFSCSHRALPNTSHAGGGASTVIPARRSCSSSQASTSSAGCPACARALASAMSWPSNLSGSTVSTATSPTCCAWGAFGRYTWVAGRCAAATVETPASTSAARVANGVFRLRFFIKISCDCWNNRRLYLCKTAVKHNCTMTQWCNVMTLLGPLRQAASLPFRIILILFAKSLI